MNLYEQVFSNQPGFAFSGDCSNGADFLVGAGCFLDVI